MGVGAKPMMKSVVCVLYFGACMMAPVGASVGPSSELLATLSSSTLEVSSSESVKVEAIIRNRGRTSEVINLFTVRFPQLSLEVLDSSGKVITPIPPPVPPREIRKYDRVLRPSEELRFTYRLRGMFRTGLPEGSYAVRMRGISSNELRFSVRR
jgi:hypothetical protein